MISVTPELLLRAYENGVFPMAEHRFDDRLAWIDPKTRGILPFETFHVPRSLAKVVRRDTFEIHVDRAFLVVVRGCAAPGPDRWGTWISERIENLYGELHAMGHAHSVEAWADGELVGGLYGVVRGAAFFGESMFSRATDASKVALVHLMARLKVGRFRLVDTQFVTDHLQRLGAVEVGRQQYHRLLLDALEHKGDFFLMPQGVPGASALQSLTQTS
jgi:leucyl/phenylalanyl-tRNA--protein transferase